MPKKTSPPLPPFPLNTRIILDSGAFTAWTKRTKIDIDQYADFCLDHLDVVDHFVSLDSIPGTFGESLIPMSEIRRAAEEGWENYQYLLSRGIPEEKLLHVFHQGEEFKWLDRIAHNTYIGISPANDRNTRDRMAWLDECMKHITDENGNLTTQFHGLAVTSLRLMLRYPWTSVDSASWKRNAAYGKVYIPSRIASGSPDWSKQGLMIIVSQQQSHKKDHIGNMPKIIQENVEKVIDDVGIATLDEMQFGKVWPRATWNCYYFIRLQQTCNTRIFFAAVDKLSIPSIIQSHKAAEETIANVLFSYEYLTGSSSQVPAWKNMIEQKRGPKKKEEVNGNKDRQFTRRTG